jgi:hypothetical protein
MVASITLPSGNLPDLLAAMFSGNDSAQGSSLFDVLLAATAQDDGSSTLPVPVPTSAPLNADAEAFTPTDAQPAVNPWSLLAPLFNDTPVEPAAHEGNAASSGEAARNDDDVPPLGFLPESYFVAPTTFETIAPAIAENILQPSAEPAPEAQPSPPAANPQQASTPVPQTEVHNAHQEEASDPPPALSPSPVPNLQAPLLAALPMQSTPLTPILDSPGTPSPDLEAPVPDALPAPADFSGAAADLTPTTKSNSPPDQIRLALANVPGSPALIVRNIIIAQLPLQAQSDEHPAPATNPQVAENDGSERPTPTPQVAAASEPGAPPPQAEAEAKASPEQIDRSVAIQETAITPVEAQNEPAPNIASLDLIAPAPPPPDLPEAAVAAVSKQAAHDAPSSEPKPPAPAANQRVMKESDKGQKDTVAINPGLFAFALVAAPLPAPLVPPPTPIAPEMDAIPAVGIDADAGSDGNSPMIAPQPPLSANTAPASTANPSEPAPVAEQTSPQPANGNAESLSAIVAKLQPNPPDFRTASTTARAAKPVAAPQSAPTPSAETSEGPITTGNSTPRFAAPMPPPDAEAIDTDPGSPQTADTPASLDSSLPAPKTKSAHATQAAPEPQPNPALPPPVTPQVSDATPHAAAPAASEPLTLVAAPPVPASASADPPIRVSSIALAGWPDSGLMDALALKIAAKSTDGDANFHIRLDPPELGRIEVNLNVGANGNAGASLTADKPQTLDLLQRDSGALERALKDAGLDLTGGLSFSLKGDARSGAWRDAQNGRTRSLNIGAIEANTASTIAAAASTPYGLGANGRLDITV